MGYRCVNCGVRKEEGSKVYFVSNGNDNILEPTCSKKCAEQLTNHYINILKSKIKTLQETDIVEEVWDLD